MAHVHAAAENERLPWLTDEKVSRGPGSWLLLVWALAATLLVAGSSFWLGMNGGRLPAWGDFFGTPQAPPQPKATVKLPEPAVAQRAAQPAAPVMPQVEPVPTPAPLVIPKAEEIRPARAGAEPRRTARKPARRVLKRAVPSDDSLRSVVSKQQSDSTPKAAAKPNKTIPQLWDAWESAGASGRMVRIGTYSSRAQAKRAWSRMVKLYPGMKRLRAVTTDIPSSRNGRTYYRLQFGTTSQAHSEVLCQRMRTIGQSCVVVDVAGARTRNVDERQPIGL